MSNLNSIAECNDEMKAWEGKNPMLWKKAFNRRKELIALDKEEIIVVKDKPAVIKKVIKPKKVFDDADVNKDGKVDVTDAIEVVKKVFSKKKGKKKK